MATDSNIRIFLVDDDPFCINLYQQYLNGLGYMNITAFENGPDCINSLSLKPDVIFLDHGMDYLTGLEVLRKIRAHNRDIFVIFLTGQPGVMTAIKALRLGATEYIVKGIYDMDLIKKVLATINMTISIRRSEIEAGYIDRLLHTAK